jgi:CubicO group peptidase (beta-lactamase class C family)
MGATMFQSVFLVLVFALRVELAIAAAAESPSDNWPRATPSSVGLETSSLDALSAEIAGKPELLIDSLSVFRCDKFVYERRYAHPYSSIYAKEVNSRGPLNTRLTGSYNYFDPAWHPYWAGTSEHSLQSISKTVTSVTLGVAITRGDFKAPLNTPVLGYFAGKNVRNVDERKRRMTLRDVLTMSAGLDWNEDTPIDDPTNAGLAMEASYDWVQFVMDRPMLHEPGQVFAYSSGASELLAYIFQQETGQDIERYASEHLFEPLGIKHYFWKRTPSGLVDTEGGLYLRPEDLARIGDLFLQGGTWRGRRIVSQEWIRDSLTPRMDAGDGWKYGYQWWVWPHGDPTQDAWVARGFGGQRMFIFPERSLIFVITGWRILDTDAAAQMALDSASKIFSAARPQSCAP